MQKIVLSGIQPTSHPHLGNYFGAIKNWVKLQENADYKNIYFIVDMHAITVYQDPQELYNNTLSMVATVLACGIDPAKSILFVQSQNPHHSELAWILNCIARVGWLSRMTQFKDKAGENQEKSSVGLYTYPVLQAADILLYDTDIVPVGQDQKQHIELARDIAIKFNNDYKSPIAFKVPEPYIIKNSAKIMSLQDALKKMSKSDPKETAKINLTDSNDVIISKIAKAKTDSGLMPTNVLEAQVSRPEIYNLLELYSLCSGEKIEDIALNYAGQGFANFKKQLAENIISVVEPVNKKYNDLIKNKDYLLQVLKKGKEQSLEISTLKIQKIRQIIGYVI
jgi:tryptophanyl-tRNA synthetase